jgi:hypothetical protein
MTLPYQTATSGAQALADLHKILTRFGCARFGTMTDIEHGELIVQFTFRGRDVSVRASFRGYAAAILREKPYTTRMRCTRVEYEKRAMAQAETSVHSVLRDWIKGQVTAVETGILTFEGAFLGQILLSDGKSFLDHAITSRMLTLEPPND